MINTKNFSPRLYQETILNTSIEKNTLVVLPTGTGKTASALLLAIHRLNKFPETKVLICTPTKPLSNQICQYFKNHSTINPEQIILFTGAINPEKRKILWQSAQVIVATPQTIKEDLINNRISLDNLSLLVIDEAHRTRLNYAHNIVTDFYVKQSKFPRILALTASPGDTKERIQEICDNLHIEAVEIRNELDADVEPYTQKKDILLVEVKLPDEFIKIKDKLKSVYKERLGDVKKAGFTKPVNLITKRDLLELQSDLRLRINEGDNTAFFFISRVAQALKLEYAIELLETQSIDSLAKYLEKLKNDKSKAAKAILKDKKIIEVIKLTNELLNKNEDHPKIKKLIEIIQESLEQNINTKIIIFANYRSTVNYIVNKLKNIPNSKPTILLGQKEGITQKIQIETIKEFEEGKYNILVASSIGEEGLSIGTLDLAIFYDNVPTSIRRIQRAGRVARIKPGKILYLITKGTRDEGYYWKSKRDEGRMKDILTKMKFNQKEEKQSFITKF